MYFENCILNQYLEYMILRDNIKENINIQDIRGVTSQDVTKQINVTRREITSNDNLRPENITLYIVERRSTRKKSF